MGDRFFNFRNRTIASPRFRAWAEKLPIFQKVARHNSERLFTLAGGFIHSQVLLACTRLGLFQLLRNGPMSVASIVAHVGSERDALVHLLRAAAALELLEFRGKEFVGLGVLGASMVDNPALECIIDHHEQLYRDLIDPVGLFAGDSVAKHMRSLWPYATANESSSAKGPSVERYTELMATSQAMVAEQVLGAYSLRGHESLLDIGGGAGAFAMAALQQWPQLSITVADLPAVAEIARRRLADDGLGDRIRVIGVDASRDALPDGFDIVSLVRILHDHDDAMVRKLVRAAHGALAGGGTLVIAEPMADAPGAGRLIDAYFNVYLHAMGSGRPRRFADIEHFLVAAGFSDVRRRTTRIPLVTSVITARKAG